MSITVTLATSAEERAQLHRFRYSVYVEEMGRRPTHANPVDRTLTDPLDAAACNFIALDGGRVIGALRANLGRDSDFGPYSSLYQMERAGRWYPDHVSMTSRFMIAPDYRGTSVGMRLILACFELGVERDVYFDFMDTNRHLEALYTRFGYVPYRGRVIHPEFGDVLPMVLNLTDTQHLESVGSPYVRVRRHQPWIGVPIAFPNAGPIGSEPVDGLDSTQPGRSSAASPAMTWS